MVGPLEVSLNNKNEWSKKVKRVSEYSAKCPNWVFPGTFEKYQEF